MIRFSIAILLLLSLLMIGCTDNSRARVWGGTWNKDLPPGKKLVLATWKEAELWILYRDRRPDEVPETYTFQEDSQFGVMEGTVIIRESK